MIYSMLGIVQIYIFLYIRICLQVSTSVYREGDTDATANPQRGSSHAYPPVTPGECRMLNTPQTEGYFSWRVVQRIGSK